MGKYALKHDIDGCIGCGACASICPSSWEMKNNAAGELKAFSLKKEISEEEFKENMEAAESCPVNVIFLFDETGKKLI